VQSRWKYKARATLDMLAIGFTGNVMAPSSLVLAFPGALDDDDQPVTAGLKTVLSKAVAKSILPLLRPSGTTSSELSPGAPQSPPP
jgi:hypothetical protein